MAHQIGRLDVYSELSISRRTPAIFDISADWILLNNLPGPCMADGNHSIRRSTMKLTYHQDLDPVSPETSIMAQGTGVHHL